MALQLKAGVDWTQMHYRVVDGVWVATSIFELNGLNCVVTSCRDGNHKKGSLHYQGKAADLRSKHIPRDKLDHLLSTIREKLIPGYDFILEYRDQPNEHFHLEWDPKPGEGE